MNALLPSNTPIGNGTFTVIYNDQNSATAPIQVVATAFGIYMWIDTAKEFGDPAPEPKGRRLILA